MVGYAESPTASHSIDIAAAAERVWALVTDIDLPARFSDEFRGAEWLDGATSPRLGARFRGTNEHPAIGTWQVTCTVVACEEPTSFAWTVGDVDHGAATWRFDLAPGEGATTLTYTAVMGPGPSGLTPMIDARPEREERLVAGRLEQWRTNMEATLAGIRDLAEGAGE